MRPRDSTVARPAVLLLGLTLLLLLAGCGTPSAKPTPVPTEVPTPTPTPQPLLAVVQSGSPQNSLLLITLNGQLVARTLIAKNAVIAGTTATEVAFESNDQMEALQSNGQVVSLGSMQGFKGGRVVLSPDGKQWMWSTYNQQSGGEVHSFIYLDDRLVADDVLHDRFFEPVAWTSRGVVFEQAQMGPPGYQPFDLVTGSTMLLQPGQQSPGSSPRGTQLTSTSCLYADLAADGSVVCRTPGSSVTSTGALQFQPASGAAYSVTLPQPQFAEAGAISFVPPTQQSPSDTPTEAVVGGAQLTGASTGGQGETYETAIVNLSTHTLTPLSTPGLRPGSGSWTWVSPTELIAYRPAGATGGNPGIYLVDTNGQANTLWPNGTPVGLLDQGGASGGGGSPAPSPSGSPSPGGIV